MSDDEDLQLPADTLAALREFAQEQDERTKKFEALSQQAEADYEARKNMDLFQEDWQLSQFWYSEATADVFAHELLDKASSTTQIAVVSAPSTYAALVRIGATPEQLQNIYLLEFDRRFEALAGDHFVYYDYNKPIQLRPDLKGKFDRIMIDPPFLEPDCQTKAALTARWLLRDAEDCRIILATGERMAELVPKVYRNTRVTTFFPEHANGLSNEFRCYSNYEGSRWKFQ